MPPRRSHVVVSRRGTCASSRQPGPASCPVWIYPTRCLAPLSVRFWFGSRNENLFGTCLRNVVSLLDRLDAHHHLVKLVATTTPPDLPHQPPYGVAAERLDAATARVRSALRLVERDAACA